MVLMVLRRVVVALSLTTLVVAQSATIVSAVGCEDTRNFATCIQNAQSLEDLCLQNAGVGNSEIVICGTNKLASEINCYLTSCWNKVILIVHSGMLIRRCTLVSIRHLLYSCHHSYHTRSP